MKKILLLSLTIFFFVSLSAQMNFGIKAGAAINDRSNNSFPYEKSLIGIQAAGFLLTSLGNSFFLQPSLGYYAKGNRYTKLTFEDQFGADIGTGNLNYRFDYLELSAPFQFKLNKSKVELFAGLGPYFSYAIGGKAVMKFVSGQPSNEPTRRPLYGNLKNFKRGDAGISFLFSAKILNHWMASMNYDLGLINTNTNNNTIKSHNLSTGLTIGYLFK